MQKTTFILNKDNIDEIKNKLAALLQKIEKENVEYKAQYDQEVSAAQAKGDPLPQYNPTAFPEIIVSWELRCEECGKKCGKLDFNYQFGVDHAFEEGAKHVNRCEDHPQT